MADAPAEAIISGELVLFKITFEKNPAIKTAIKAPITDINNSLLLITFPLNNNKLANYISVESAKPGRKFREIVYD